MDARTLVPIAEAAASAAWDVIEKQLHDMGIDESFSFKMTLSRKKSGILDTDLVITIK